MRETKKKSNKTGTLPDLTEAYRVVQLEDQKARETKRRDLLEEMDQAYLMIRLINRSTSFRF